MNNCTLPPAALPTAGFALADQLLALLPGSAVQPLDYRQRGKTDADWIIGIKPVSDDASVHAGHWERHPHGEEVLCLLEGCILVTLSVRQQPEQQVRLSPGQALIVPRGTWHRLQVEQAGRLMFVTPSVGSEHRKVADGLDAERDAPGAEVQP